MMDTEPWELYYWPVLPGRGELVRLVLEDRGVPYIDVGRKAKDFPSYQATVQALTNPATRTDFPPPRAQPILKKGPFVISQSTNVCLFLAKKYGLCPPGDLEYAANALALCVADLYEEVHNVHHPVSLTLYYEEQKEEALRAAKAFLKARLPTLLEYFEKVLRLNESSRQQYLVGADCSYVDLMLFQALSGLEFAFPKFWKASIDKYALLGALKERIAHRESLQAYFKSDRRMGFKL